MFYYKVAAKYTFKLSIFFILSSLILFPSAGSTQENSTKTLYEKNSLYQFLRVVEDSSKKERYIYVDNQKKLAHGGISLESPDKLLFEYTRISFISLAFMDREPKDVLFVGMGAGIMPKYFINYYPDSMIDNVEIDPEMVMIAKDYFDFQDKENMKVHVMDGRVFIKRTTNKYDIIFLDAYQGEHIPFHLTTVEFLREVKKRLKDGGIVTSNILAENKNKFFYSMIKTYLQEFSQLYIYQGRVSDNFIFIATADSTKKESIHAWVRAKELMKQKKFNIDLPVITQSHGHYTDYEKDAKILTDDFAPVNIYKHMKVQ
jgi:spermidine synthase